MGTLLSISFIPSLPKCVFFGFEAEMTNWDIGEIFLVVTTGLYFFSIHFFYSSFETHQNEKWFYFIFNGIFGHKSLGIFNSKVCSYKFSLSIMPDDPKNTKFKIKNFNIFNWIAWHAYGSHAVTHFNCVLYEPWKTVK